MLSSVSSSASHAFAASPRHGEAETRRSRAGGAVELLVRARDGGGFVQVIVLSGTDHARVLRSGGYVVRAGSTNQLHGKPLVSNLLEPPSLRQPALVVRDRGEAGIDRDVEKRGRQSRHDEQAAGQPPKPTRAACRAAGLHGTSIDNAPFRSNMSLPNSNRRHVHPRLPKVQGRFAGAPAPEPARGTPPDPWTFKLSPRSGASRFCCAC